MIQPQAIGPIPEETVGVAHAAFPKGNLYMTMRDEIGTLYTDQDFEALFHSCVKFTSCQQQTYNPVV